MIAQEENVTLRATVSVGQSEPDSDLGETLAGHVSRIGTRPFSQKISRGPAVADAADGGSVLIDPLAQSNEAAWRDGLVEENTVHAHHLETFGRISSLNRYGFSGDALLEWVPTAAGVYNISLVVTQKIPTSADPIVRHLHVPGSPFSLRVTPGPSYPPNAWGHDVFQHSGLRGRSVAEVDQVNTVGVICEEQSPLLRDTDSMRLVPDCCANPVNQNRSLSISSNKHRVSVQDAPHCVVISPACVLGFKLF